MQHFHLHTNTSKTTRRSSTESGFALRFWLGWLLLIAVLLYASHAYFEYRNMELDKRLEKLKTR